MAVTCKQITADVLKVAVAKEHNVPKESIEIENIRMSAGSKKGDGFACEIAAVEFEATFAGQTLSKNYIAKYAGFEGQRREMLQQWKAFDQECLAYTWLIPSLRKLRDEKHLKPLAFARCFYASVDECLIILENLKIQNYVVVHKKPEPLTLNAVKLVLKEMAAFHATGQHFIATYPGGLDVLAQECRRIFTEDFFNMKDGGHEILKQFNDMISAMFGSCTVVSKKFGSEELGQKMEAYNKIVRSVTDKLFSDQGKGKMLYVTLGDAWYNNFLYRYSNLDSADPTDVIMLDLQNTRIGRPGIELAYFFCSSTSPQQRKDHFEELLKFYYDCFFEELKNLGDNSEPYFSFEDLKQEYDECYNYGFILGCMHSQMYLVTENANTNFEIESLGDESATTKMLEGLEAEFLKKAESSPEFRNLVIGLAEEAAQKNVI